MPTIRVFSNAISELLKEEAAEAEKDD